ncbi:MAG: DNA-directed RNA polymerase subunit H [Candidatus Aenigmarchaeota archaeon CG_4_10_14_0_8_um_filter_37_24]|nr:DNA-directed RNA polymerase subunit H [Candidatus Aenigmarchaeota archaeon]OIN87901.1 MAG: DNA-directed RNA polymerase subunit H [Candidatus Aenigmarchaeota archaeon CG1_02_38_14]PIV68594.1 MAG: DNA-directed RNA polymerase subunit H [Candidatus Aenigmarchaeota archaeon CG01_land_8_20_14_3_00_37_9]PIW41598.1 MAG: DNA-directed RNA polymerase subunit H [Candidatus Aenigmarchaeota archaeon CG15_BIG_FIL_POST_REV_8_21_14_020_37_27]PIX51196.1 MAG: DNA-directed RNA polymerase subunit H [Candidatus A
MAEEKKEIDILKHELVPKHRILNEEEKKKLFEKYGVKYKDLPRINLKDPAVVAVGAKAWDVIEIERKSLTAGETKYYRVVVPNR